MQGSTTKPHKYKATRTIKWADDRHRPFTIWKPGDFVDVVYITKDGKRAICAKGEVADFVPMSYLKKLG